MYVCKMYIVVCQHIYMYICVYVLNDILVSVYQGLYSIVANSLISRAPGGEEGGACQSGLHVLLHLSLC